MKDYLLNLVSSIADPAAKTNIMREYLQVYALRAMFEKGHFAQVAFVGGTALRFIFNVPRFSEDLDFSIVNSNGYDFKHMLDEIKQVFTSANYLMSIKFKSERIVNTAFLKFPELFHLAGMTHRKDQNLSIKLDIDTNPPKGATLASSLVNKYFPITFSHYDLPSLFAGKLHAFFTRPYVKGRDYFDIIWLLSRNKDIQPNFILLNNALEQTGNAMRVTVSDWKEKVLERANLADWQSIISDVEKFSEDPQFIKNMRPEYMHGLLF